MEGHLVNNIQRKKQIKDLQEEISQLKIENDKLKKDNFRLKDKKYIGSLFDTVKETFNEKEGTITMLDINNLYGNIISDGEVYHFYISCIKCIYNYPSQTLLNKTVRFISVESVNKSKKSAHITHIEHKDPIMDKLNSIENKISENKVYAQAEPAKAENKVYPQAEPAKAENKVYVQDDSESDDEIKIMNDKLLTTINELKIIKTKKIKTIYENAVESYKHIRNSADELSLKLIELEKEYSDKIDTFLKKTKYYKLLKDIS